MKVTDLQNICTTIGMSNELENPLSVQWNTIAVKNGSGGVGLTNNRPYMTTTYPGGPVPIFLAKGGQNADTFAFTLNLT